MRLTRKLEMGTDKISMKHVYDTCSGEAAPHMTPRHALQREDRKDEHRGRNDSDFDKEFEGHRNGKVMLGDTGTKQTGDI